MLASVSTGAHRTAEVHRATRETDILARVDLDGSGEVEVATPIGFLTHMIETLGRHSLVDLTVRASGDVNVDQHHTVEDTGFVIGQAIARALGERRGISRAGWARHPMDEALADAAIDLSGRPCLVLEARFEGAKVGELETSLVHDFFDALARALGANIHLDLVRGRNDHHRVEALFKAFARALRMAVAREPRLGDKVPSAKGSLDLGAAAGGI
jgi:imidazoleglycerol-phosphate dehydratase